METDGKTTWMAWKTRSGRGNGNGNGWKNDGNGQETRSHTGNGTGNGKIFGLVFRIIFLRPFLLLFLLLCFSSCLLLSYNAILCDKTSADQRSNPAPLLRSSAHGEGRPSPRFSVRLDHRTATHA